MPGKNVQNGVAAGRGSSPAKSPAAERMIFDPEDPEYIKDLQRPAVIKEDLNEMERRKRVRQILESKAFREELEQLITSERQHGNTSDNLRALEQLSELILPAKSGGIGLPTAVGNYAGHAVVPIADLRGAEGAKYSKQERMLRNRLAGLYRLVDLFQWSQGIYNHITLRLSSEHEHFLINPFGLLYHEISASSLVKVDLQGNVIEAGSTDYGINQAGYVLHSAIHQARPDVRCIVHLHTPVVGAVAAMKCGLLPISQEAMIVGPVSYHEFKGIVNDPGERDSIAHDLGPVNKVMLLRNHGFVACAESIEEAFHLAYHVILACDIQVLLLQGDGYIVVGDTVEEAFHITFNLIQACEAQVRAARAGIENLTIPDEEAQRRAYETAKQGGGGVNRSADGRSGIKWRCGELEWEAWMRVLDNAGFRTGHIYRQPVLRSKAPAPQSDVEVPPAACAYGMLEETDATTAAQKLAHIKREQEKIRWLNSPNVYQKVEFEETGTSDPKKLTKWVQDASSPVHSTVLKLAAPNQFAPISQNPKEFKDKQKAIKEARRADNISAGPQSKILEGVTWQDAATKVKDADVSGTQEKIIIGAASKGIIDREYRHNAQIYRQLYQPNPFASETDEDIQKYMRDVETKKTPAGGDASFDGKDDHHHHHDKTSAGSQSPEEVSLMQAAREYQYAPAQDRTAPISGTTTRETTFDGSPTRGAISPSTRETSSSSKIQPSSSGGWFQRSRSERFFGKKEKDNAHRVEERIVASDEEAHALDGSKSPDKKEKKKKKFKTPSFLRPKKDKEKRSNE